MKGEISLGKKKERHSLKLYLTLSSSSSHTGRKRRRNPINSGPFQVLISSFLSSGSLQEEEGQEGPRRKQKNHAYKELIAASAASPSWGV